MPSQITAKKAIGSHYTPHHLARFIAQKVIATNLTDFHTPTIILDPACGDGELLLAIAHTTPAPMRSNVTLVGIDSEPTALSAAQNRLINTLVAYVSRMKD